MDWYLLVGGIVIGAIGGLITGMFLGDARARKRSR